MKGKLKKFTAVALALVLTGAIMTGCGGNNSTSTKAPADTAAAGNSTGNETTAEGETAAEGSTAWGENGLSEYFAGKDHYTLKVMTFGDADTATLEKINAKLSEYTEPALNCDVEITRVGFASYVTQLNLLLSSGDELDLIVPMSAPVDYINAGQLQPITDLLETYAPNLSASVTELDYVNQQFNGDIYGMPNNAEKGSTVGFGMRKDICDELGIDYENMSSFDELHDALVKVKEAHPDMYPVVSNSGHMFSSSVANTGQDSCGDTYNLAVLDNQFSDDCKIMSWFETDQFKEVCTRMYQWAQEGLIMPDASTNSDAANTLVAAGKAFGYFQHMKPGWETEQSIVNGTETVAWRYGVPTFSGGSMGWFVPTSSGDPERAVAFFDMMYSIPEISNLVINGIEGEDYVFVEGEDNIITYPEGKDASTTSYSRFAWAWPNQQIAYFWEGEDTTLWEQYAQFNEAAQVPKSLGFTFDASSVMNQITACNNVYEKYVPALLCGSLDPETTIPELNEAMEKAGIGDIVAAKQEQFDAWRAANAN